jgi:hypothetical protein
MSVAVRDVFGERHVCVYYASKLFHGLVGIVSHCPEHITQAVALHTVS